MDLRGGRACREQRHVPAGEVEMSISGNKPAIAPVTIMVGLAVESNKLVAVPLISR